MSWSLDGQPLRSVLVTRLRYLGDIAMSTVVLAVLRRGDPELDLGYLCEAGHAPLLRGHPHLDRVHALAARRRGADARVRAGGGDHAAGRGTLGCVREIRRQGYDLAVDLLFNPRSAWLLRLAGIPLRIGGTRSWRRRLYTHTAPAFDDARMTPERRRRLGGLADHLARLAPLRHEPTGLPFARWLAERVDEGDLRPRVTPPACPAGLAAELAALGTGGGRGYVLLAPGATWPSKEWPAPRWRELAGLLARDGDRSLVVLRPPARAEAYRAVAAGIPDGRGGVLPALSLAEALAVVAGADLVVSVDGGVMHAAVAMGRPTVALFGPTSPAIWFPYEGRGPFRVLAERPPCHPCDRHECREFVCLPDLAPERVAAAARSLLAEKERR